ncbi:MAG: twin-arginine translocation signal domain-containing protein [Actinomycetota bacterium]|nr:twin-arginine translocation signal domain-containing protein [Actinomycetota bacterium]
MDSVGTEQEAMGILDRRDFLKLAGAAGIGAAAGAGLLQSGAGAAVRTDLEPTDFTFTTRERFRPFHILAENFVRLDDSFNRNTRGNYTLLRPGPASEDDGFVDIGEGKARFGGQDDYYTILKSGTGQRAPFATVIVNVASLSADGTVYAGLYKDNNNYVHVYYDKDRSVVGIEARVNGETFLGPDSPFGEEQVDREELRGSFRFAFVVNENRVIALVGDRHMDIGNFRPLIERDVFFETGIRQGEDEGALDLRRRGVLATFKNGFGARSETGSNIVFDRVRAGYFGEAGVRDLHTVQYADGTPYIKDNKLYFTLTNAGLGFFEKAHWGVWTMDLSDYSKIEQVGNIFWYNEGEKNIILGHHAGQIIRDEKEDRWIVVVSSWGDFGRQGGDQGNFGTVTYPDEVPRYEPPVDILYAELDFDVNPLRGVHILEGKKHPVNAVPFPTEGKWDPGLTRIDGRWYMGYVIALDLFSDFQPALAKSPRGADHTQVNFVGADWAREATEGPIIQKLGGEWRLFASHGDDEGNRDGTNEKYINRYPIYFLRSANPGANEENREAAEAERGQRLAFDGYLEAPHPTNIPHPVIVPIRIRRDGRTRTKYIMITFNGDQFFERVLGYGTHGDFFVMQAEQTVRGYEF